MAKEKPAKPSEKTKDPAPAKSPKDAPKAAKLAKENGSIEAAKEKPAAKHNAHPVTTNPPNGKPAAPAPVELTPFLERQKERLLQLRDSMLDSMMGVAKDNLRTRAEGSEASAFGMHQADAGSDAYDRDFALSLLSQEQDALYEIEEALKRIDLGAYGVCEMSGKPISHARLEALPFARYTVECQSQIEKQGKVTRARVPVTSLFGLTDEEPTENEEEEPVSDNKE
jgi:DnaK suppressor protein